MEGVQKVERSQEFRDRLQLFRDNIAMKHTERIPIMSKAVTWQILDCGCKFNETMSNYEKMQKVVEEYHHRYEFDSYIGVTARNPLAITNALGGGFYSITDDAINYYDHVLMESDEYDDFLKDPKAFRWKMFQRKYPELTKGQMVDGVREFIKYLEFSDGMIEKFASEYHRPAIFNTNLTISLPFENFYNNYRGIKEVSLDMRKQKGKLKEAMDWIFENENTAVLNNVVNTENNSFVCDTFLVLLGHSILNRRQWEELYWPYLKKIIDTVIENDKTIYISVESSIARFAEYFQDFPKGHIVLELEEDNIFEMRKLLPNICLAGGMTCELLGRGTKEECVDFAKRLLEEVGDGFIMGQNKMMSFRNDCKRENLLAVVEYVKNYKR